MNAKRIWILFATGLELSAIESRLGPPKVTTGVIGVGPLLAAAETAQLLGTELGPELILAGVAGSYDLVQAPLGSCHRVEQMTLEGIGVGTDIQNHRPLADLDLQLTAKDPFDPWPLHLNAQGPGVQSLTVCATSADFLEASQRKAKHKEALLEEMEGYAVAYVARKRQARLLHLRSVSNRAGDRNKAQWDFAAAFDTLAMSLAPYWTLD